MRTQVVMMLGCLSVVIALAQVGHSVKVQTDPGITLAAEAWLESLTAEQRQVALYPADSPEQVGWHFIPMDARKGLELNKMSEPQRAAVLSLLKTLLSDIGYTKATKIMELEKLLKELQDKHGGNGPIRDPLRYFVTMFGTPSESGRWALSFEGHHLSLNYVIEAGQVVASTPQFFATNPAVVKSENSVGVELGTRYLRFEETIAFELVQSLSKQQRASAIIAEEAPREIRAAGSAQPPQEEAVGIRAGDLSAQQRKLLRRLVNEYVKAVPADVAAERNAAINEAGFRELRFAWAGADVPGVGHYYRVQGPTFLIEFVNTQPDSDGNPANHIHSVWRDMRGDFGKSL